MTIWYFGDSYNKVLTAKRSKYSKLIKYQWTQNLSKRLNQPYKSYAVWGGTLDYTYESFNENRHLIKRKDIVIICLSRLYDRWLFRDHPEYTYKDPPKKTLARATKYFREYLNTHHQLYHNGLINFLYNVQEITIRLKLHTIIIPSNYCCEMFLSKEKHKFKKMHFAEGCLLNVSLHEYHEDLAKKIEEFSSCGRLNHLSKTNHRILVKKLLSNIEENIPINLNTQFKKHFITEDKHNDPLFRKKEYCPYYRPKLIYKK